MSQRLSSQELLARVKGEVKEMSMEELKEKLDRKDDLVLIDVREQDEVDQGVIVGATHIPRGFLELRVETTESDRDREIVLYCAGGNRSALAAQSLEAMGYTNVISMREGYTGWRDAGLPVVQERS